jgi:hypothetical protein
MSHTDDKTGSTPQPPAKPYTPPRIVSYGHVKDLVQGNQGGGLDASGGHSKQCWIAEALYGADDPRTHLLRAWLTVVHDQRRPGWMFVVLYRVCGRGTARLISSGALPARWFRPLFDSLVDRALADAPRVFALARR